VAFCLVTAVIHARLVLFAAGPDFGPFMPQACTKRGVEIRDPDIVRQSICADRYQSGCNGSRRNN
jgi:hypothetical protein